MICPPTATRTISAEVGVIADSSLVISAPVSFPFSMALRYLRTSPSAVVEQVTEDAYYRPLRLNGRAFVLRVSQDAPTTLNVALDGPVTPTPADLDAAAAITRRVFGLDIDTGPLLSDVAADSRFLSVAQRFAGLRPVQIADPFETVIWAILGQQINVRFAATLKQALVMQFGAEVKGFGRSMRLFPEPEQLAALDHERDLRPLQFSRQKSEYSILVAWALVDGTLDLDGLRSNSSDAVIAVLTGIKGIGRWTAEYVAMRGLGFPDVIPAGDGGLKRIIGREYGFNRLATETEVRAIAESWRPWRSFAAFYWWFTLQLESEKKERSV